MKRNSSLFIIIFSTFVSVTTMVTYDSYASNSKYYEENKLPKQGIVKYNKGITNSETGINDSHVKMMEKDKGKISNIKDNLEEGYLPDKKSNNVYKAQNRRKIHNSNIDIGRDDTNKDPYNKIHLDIRNESVGSYYYNSKEAERSVFKVSTGDIKENLTTSDKIKLLYVSLKLGKETYRKVEEYLYADNAEEGVLQALKLLKEDLSKKEYEKVRKIAGKFIDMDAAEKLY